MLRPRKKPCSCNSLCIITIACILIVFYALAFSLVQSPSEASSPSQTLRPTVVLSQQSGTHALHSVRTRDIPPITVSKAPQSRSQSQIDKEPPPAPDNPAKATPPQEVIGVFSTDGYYIVHPDVVNNKRLDAWGHYSQHGFKEGRLMVRD